MAGRNRLRERRAVTATSVFAGWGDSLSVTGIVPPHGYESLQRAGVNVTVKTVLSIGTVVRCIEVIQNAFFVMGHPLPYVVEYDKSGYPYKSWITPSDRRYPKLLQAPWGTSPFADNAPVAYNVGCGRTVISQALFGEAWWVATARDTFGNVTSMEPLHPVFLTFDVNHVSGDLQKITYGVGAKQVEITQADLVHIPRLILPGDRQAVNPVHAEAPMFAIAIAAVQYSQMWFAQGGQASYVLTTPTRLGKDEVDRIFEHLLLEHSGINAAWQPLILDSGITPQVIQTTPTKSQMNETLNYVRSEIAGYFGVPLHLVGATGDQGMVWGKGIQEENFSFLDFTLSGYRLPYEEALSQISPGGVQMSLNQRALLKSNTADLSKGTMANRTVAKTTPNEERRWTTLPPLPTEAADKITTPLNSAPMPTSGGTGSTAGGGGTSGGTGG